MQDFERCTPSEFNAVFDVWNNWQEKLEQGKWERVRMSSLCSLQPYSKKRLSASDIMEFPWEKKEKTTADTTSREEMLERFAEAKKRYGLK